MAETSSSLRGWLIGLGILVALFLLVLAPLVISNWMPGQSYKPEMSFEMAVIESLAEKPKDVPELASAVMRRVTLQERQLRYLQVPYNADPDESAKLARRDEAEYGAVDSPVVWYDGFGSDDVRKLYHIRFDGGGGCWGCGAARGYFRVYVGQADRIVGWYTHEPAWRAKVLEMTKP